MKRKRIAAVLVIAASLTGCSTMKAGTVIDKSHDEARTTFTTICSGQPLICRPQPIYDDEDWDLQIREGDQEGWVGVSEETFDRVEVGDYWEAEK